MPLTALIGVVVVGIVAGSIYRSQSNVTKVVTSKATSQDLVSIVSGTGQIKPSK